jgi:uncharacterized surface protein with fasciclin (FAS1) repeats
MKQLRISSRLSLIAAGIALACGSALTAQQSQSQSGAQGQQRHQSESQQGSSSQNQPQQNRNQGSQAQSGQQGSQTQSGQQQAQRQSQGSQSQGSQSQGAGSLDQLTQEHDNLSTFVRALRETGLAEELTGDTKYTVFAPTDEAFQSMGRSVDQLLAPENRQQLISILRAHIVADDVDPQMARRIEEALTLDGDTVALAEQNGKLMVGDASVVDSNIQQGNLRIYSIDQVLDRGESQVATSESQQRQR